MTTPIPKRSQRSSLLGTRHRGICNSLVELERLLMCVCSAAVTWGLYALGCNPKVHAKLNTEARAFHKDTPSMDELNEMTYLDYFTREVLRIYAPVSQSDRVAKEDTVVPVDEPYVDRHGIKRHEIRWVYYFGSHVLSLQGGTQTRRFRKGDQVLIPIRAINRLKSLWGKDANEFK
jgi:hypothetical protein